MGASGDPAAAAAAATSSSPRDSAAAAAGGLPRLRRRRPADPDRPDSTADPYLGQPVSVFRNGGWWSGRCSAVSGSQYTVSFPDTGVQMEFHSLELAWPWEKQFTEVHRPPFSVSASYFLNFFILFLKAAEPAFGVGDEVEVFRKRRNYGVSWLGATVLEVVGKTSFRVEYDRLAGDGGGFLKETVGALYMRPVKKFGLLDEVEACCYGGWSAGVVSRIISPSKYAVKLKHAGEREMVFHCSDLRPRWEWVLGGWSPAVVTMEKELVGFDVDAVDKDNICTKLRGNRSRKKNKVLAEREEQFFELNKRLKIMEGFEIPEDAQLEEEKEEKEEEEEAYSKKNLVWTFEMDRCLTDALVKQMYQGNKVGKSFASRAYAAACDEIYDKFGMQVTPAHLKNRLKTLKKDLIGFQDLESSGNGFFFNKITKRMDAEPTVWEAYIKEHPEGKHFRHKAVPCFENLSILFGKDQLVGQVFKSAREKYFHLEDHDELDTNNHDTIQETEAEYYVDSGGESISTSFRMKQTRNGPSPSRRERGIDNLKQFSKLTSQINAVASAIERCAPRTITEDQLFNEVRKIKGLDEDFQLQAYDYLCGNAPRGRTFLGLPIDRRRRWLELKLKEVAEHP